MNRKIALLTALSLIAGTAFCACGSDKKEDKDSSISSSADESPDSKPDKTVNKNEADVFEKYLKEQKLCSISKGFKILEPGTARENPDGLAGAVKYDFDDDGDDELLTMTFDRNSKNAEDLRFDLLKLKSGKLEETDSRYITDILDMSPENTYLKKDSIYFSDKPTLQVVTSEYNGKMYIGCVISEAPTLNAGVTKFTSYSVFSCEDGEIEPLVTGAYRYSSPLTCLYNKVIPESMEDSITLEKDDTSGDEANEVYKYTIDEGKYLLYAKSMGEYDVGAYDSPALALSDMLNDFGLDLSPDSMNDHATLVSKNHSDIKPVLHLTQMKRATGEDEYIGCKLELSSDLEKLIGNDSPFYEPFRDETDAYADVLRYPYYYPEIFEPLLKSNRNINYLEYFVADINGDGKKELEINLPNDELMQGTNGLVVVFPDLTVRNPDGGNIEFSDNGMININTFTGARHIAYDLDTGCSHEYYGMDGSEHTMDADGNELTGSAAEKVSADMKAKKKGYRIYPEYQSFSVKDGLKGDIVFTEDVSTLRMTWQKAYSEQAEKYNKELSDDARYMLLELDSCSEPLLVIIDTRNNAGGGGELFSYLNGSAYGIVNLGIRCVIDGYNKKDGTILWEYSNPFGSNEYDMIKVSSDEVIIDKYVNNYNDGTYTYNDETISKEEFDKKTAFYAEHCDSKLYQDQDQYYYAEFKKLLNGDTDAKPIKISDNDSSSSGSTAIITSDDGLRMRKGAGLQYDVITVIPYKAEVEKIETQGDWVKVKYKNDTGWVSKEFLK